MHIAAGQSFVGQVDHRAQILVPDLHWVVINADGSCAEPADSCDLLVLAGESYTAQFVDAHIGYQMKIAHLSNASDGFLRGIWVASSLFRYEPKG
jgi:hypothetical protein